MAYHIFIQCTQEVHIPTSDRLREVLDIKLHPDEQEVPFLEVYSKVVLAHHITALPVKNWHRPWKRTLCLRKVDIRNQRYWLLVVVRLRDRVSYADGVSDAAADVN